MMYKNEPINYRQNSDLSRTLVGNKLVDQTDVVGASPVGAALSTYSFSISHLTSMDWAKTTTRRDETRLTFWRRCGLY